MQLGQPCLERVRQPTRPLDRRLSRVFGIQPVGRRLIGDGLGPLEAAAAVGVSGRGLQGKV